jgi:two-component system OmpR family response regulator
MEMSKANILVVDDEPKVVDIVRGYLERDGYRVSAAASGPQALEEFGRSAPDLVVLDIMLPGLDGIEVLREIRRNSRVPVIMLTARAEGEDKLVGLELGADDYVTKPFSPRELVARVKAVLRRSVPEPEAAQQKPISVGELIIDPGRFEVSCHGQQVALTATEFRILSALARSPGRVLSRNQIMDRALGESYEGYDRTIDAHIKNIRHKLSQVNGGGCNIQTVQGMGYKLEPENE